MLMLTLMLSFSVTASAASKVRLNKTKLSLNVKKTYQLKVTGTTKKAKWSTSNKTVATVNSKGKITAKKKGTATITAKVSGKKYTCKVTVKQPVTSVKLSKKTVTLKKKGRSITLKATASPTTANNKKVTWKSSNPKVATVSASGKITAVASGTAKITATAKDGSKKKATCTVIVKIASSTSSTEKHEHTWVPQYTTVTVPAETRTNTTYMPVCEHGAYLYTEYDCACGAVFKSAQEWSRHVDEMTDSGDTRNHSSSANGVYTALSTTQPKTRTVYICSCGTKFMCGKFGCDSRTEEAAIEAINHHIAMTRHTSQGKVTYQEAVVYEGETTRYDVHQEIVIVKPATTKQVLTGYKCSCGATK